MKYEPQLALAYRKDSAEEEFLDKLNAILAPAQEADYRDCEERFPTVFIVGAPRSGTTLLSQLLSTCLDVGYINNLIAAFWKAPVYGIHLSKKLIKQDEISSFQSDFGRTQQPHEPHEFGYFWSDILGEKNVRLYDPINSSTVDWHRLRYVITNMTEAFGRVTLFKVITLGWYIEQVQQVLERACFIRIRRDPIQNALSILEFRKKFTGDVEQWVSLKPQEFAWLKHKPYWYQVAGQVYFLEKTMDEQIAKVGGAQHSRHYLYGLMPKSRTSDRADAITSS